MMKNSSLTEITCIEELLGNLIEKEVFEPNVYNYLWQAYLNHVKNINQRSQNLNPEEKK